jgi:hypothetical protein
MISSPVYYYRQYKHDIPDPPFQKQLLSRAQSVLAAALPILSFIPPLRTPLSVGLGALRSVTHLQSIVEGIQQEDLSKVSIGAIQLLFTLSALALVITALVTPYFNPSTSLLLFGADDIIGNVIELVKGIKSGDKKQIIESISHLISSLLYIAFISFGHIEILATCMLLQIAVNLHKTIDEFKRGHYLEGTCHLITSALILSQVIPQMRVIEWKWRTHPTFEGELCRDEKGFVYVKVKDEIIFELNKIFGESSLPPYFGNGKFGAHVTVIPIGELGKDIHISEIGKTIKFNIAFCDSLKPEGFKGVNEVSFLSLSAPELDSLRTKYGLTPKVNGNHDFHITFGVKYEN